MSVYHQTFLLCGYRFEGLDTFEEAVVGGDEYSLFDCEFHDEYNYSKWNDDAEIGDIVMIADGRGGEYVYFGELLAKSNSTKDGPQDLSHRALDMTVPNFDTLDAIKETLAEQRIEVNEPRYHVFTHVT